MLPELVLLVLFGLCWLAAIVSTVSGFLLAGTLPPNLYALYGLAAFTGWIGGNAYVHRTASLPKTLRRRMLIVYLVGPLGLLYFLNTLLPDLARQLAPLAPVYAFGVSVVFFLVPVTFKR